MEKLELPKDIKDKILATCVNKVLCLEAMKYVYLVKKTMELLMWLKNLRT